MKYTSIILLALASCLTATAQISNIVVTSAATFRRELPTEGSLGTIFCSGLSVQGVVSADKLPLPTTLAGITVKIGGALAPLLAVVEQSGYQQINFQVPQGVVVDLQTNTTTIEVTQGNARGSTVVEYGTNTTGDFFKDPRTGFGIFQHAADYSLVTDEHPAVQGETLIGYLTGMPPALPVVPDGYPAPQFPSSQVPQFNTTNEIDELQLFVGEYVRVFPDATVPPTGPTSPIQFVGLTPGSVGLYQINFVLNLPTTFARREFVTLVRLRCKAVLFPPATRCQNNTGIGPLRWYWRLSSSVHLALGNVP